jgi:hypothetical protein
VFATAGIEGRRAKAVFTAEQAALVIYVNPELEELRQLVAGARARLAELEVDYAKEKSRVDAMQAALFRRLREHYQKRDRLRLILDYRKKYLDSLVRGGSPREIEPVVAAGPSRTGYFTGRGGGQTG